MVHWGHESASKWHLDQFSTVHQCDQLADTHTHTDRQTDRQITQTMLPATSVTTGRIYAMHAMRCNISEMSEEASECHSDKL